MTASCNFDVTVNRRPNPALSLSLSLDKNEVYAGQVVTATARAQDPDNDPLSYTWEVDGRSRRESASTLRINTGGFTGGSHSVNVTVGDDRGDSRTETRSFKVREKTVIQIDRMRPDNVAKARLDEIALRMRQGSRLKALITGHTDDRGTEENNVKAGLKRADAAKEYLVEEQQISETRIETKSAGESQPIADNGTAQGREQNRRIEIELFEP
jgi:outer membrane protein OmpA-like peptidoglycan-associated protein